MVRRGGPFRHRASIVLNDRNVNHSVMEMGTRGDFGDGGRLEP
ncbi:MAG: hypothetical protein R2865_14650 [Deinococcales bacterium]